MSRLLPLFPLQLVAFPGSAIPLHIFEERYKQMVGEAETSGTEFGIVLAKDNGIVNAGCTVVVEKVTERYPDGRFDVVARGQRRFSLISIDQEKDYLRGEVDYFDDDDWEAATPELRAKALAACRQVRAAHEDEGEDAPRSRASDVEFSAGGMRPRSRFSGHDAAQPVGSGAAAAICGVRGGVCSSRRLRGEDEAPRAAQWFGT